MKANPQPGSRKPVGPVESDASSQMHSSHHYDDTALWSRKRESLHIVLVAQRRGRKVVYRHPASLSLRVYIFPMSPIPMTPIVKFAMEEAMVAVLWIVLFGVVVLSDPGIMIA